MKVKIGVSNRHIHLCKSDADKLFGKDYVFIQNQAILDENARQMLAFGCIFGQIHLARIANEEMRSIFELGSE